MRRRIGWRICWPVMGRARGVCGVAVFAVGRGDRGDLGGAQDGGGLCADRPGAAGGADRVHARRCRADRRGDHRGVWPTRLDGCDLRSSTSTTRASTPSPAPRCRRPRPMTWPTSSTPRAPPACPRGWRSPTATSPSCSSRWRRRCWRRTGVDAVPLVCLRLLGVGDLGCAAAWGRLVVVPERWRARRKTSTPCWSREQVTVLTQTPSAVGGAAA